MYATDVRQTDVRQKHRLMPLPYSGGGITKEAMKVERHHESCEQCRGYRANVRKVTSSSESLQFECSHLLYQQINKLVLLEMLQCAMQQCRSACCCAIWTSKLFVFLRLIYWHKYAYCNENAIAQLRTIYSRSAQTFSTPSRATDRTTVHFYNSLYRLLVTTCFIHCMLLNHVLRYDSVLIKETNEWMNECMHAYRSRPLYLQTAAFNWVLDLILCAHEYAINFSLKISSHFFLRPVAPSL